MIQFPNYNHSILSLIQTVLQGYGIETTNTLLEIDARLLREKNIVVFVFDGMGSYCLSDILNESSFLMKNKKDDLSSVYPSTTAAATKSFYSGLPPITHGYLGWDCYYKEYGRNVAPLKLFDVYTKEMFCDDYVSRRLEFKTIFQKINEANPSIKTHWLMPSFMKNGYDTLDAMCNAINTICSDNNSNFIFAYWTEPDLIMHKHGVYSLETKSCLEYINNTVEELAKSLRNTTCFITADHGMKDINKCVDINEDNQLFDYLYMPPFIESRAMSLIVKPHKEDAFKEYFSNRFSEDYKLFTRVEVFNLGLFGQGQIHSKIDDFVGNYFACGINDKMILYTPKFIKEKAFYKGHHAGLTPEEMTVPLIIVDC